MSHNNDAAHPGHEVVGLVPRLLVQLVALETLGALGDSGPVHLNLATASAMHIGPYSRGRRKSRICCYIS